MPRPVRCGQEVFKVSEAAPQPVDQREDKVMVSVMVLSSICWGCWISQGCLFFISSCLFHNCNTTVCLCHAACPCGFWGCRLTQRKRPPSSPHSSHPSCESVWEDERSGWRGGKLEKEGAASPLFPSQLCISSSSRPDHSSENVSVMLLRSLSPLCMQGCDT